MNEIIDADAPDSNFVVTIKTLLPGNVSVTTHAIRVDAGNQIEAHAKAIEEWRDKVNPDNFLSVDIKKDKVK